MYDVTHKKRESQNVKIVFIAIWKTHGVLRVLMALQHKQLASYGVAKCQPLGGSISLKFLLETRLQSKFFDTLDDLLGFRVQKLGCKLVKIFD